MDKHAFLTEASLLYKDSCPELSRFLMQNRQMMDEKTNPSTNEALLCPFCFQWREADNHRVRLRPKRRPSARLQRILGREAKGRRLSLAEKDALARFRRSSSCLMATCHTCNKTARRSGPNRDFLAAMGKTTPRGGGQRKTPQSATKGFPSTSTPTSTPSQKTPFSTPRAPVSSESTSSGGKSSSSSSVKKSAFSRLKKLLMLEDSPSKTNKKGGLKDFLSAL